MKDMHPHRSGHATRRRGALTAGAIAAVAFAVIVGPHLIPGSPVSSDDRVGPTGGRTTIAGPVHLSPCPNSAEADAEPLVPADGDIPHGALRAWICPSLDAFTDWTAPLDPLTTDLNSLADQFNDLPKPTRRTACTLEGATDNYVMTFAYPGGQVLQIHGVGSGCSFVNIIGNPGSTRMGARDLFHAYVEALIEQRTHRHPPRRMGTPSCPVKYGYNAPGLLPVGHRLELTNAIVCAYRNTRRGTVFDHAASFSSAQIRVLESDFEAHAEPHVRLRCPSGVQPNPHVIVGTTAWGDRVILQKSCDGYYHVALEGLTWIPSDTVAAMIDRVIGE